ncbi:MAG: ABC transporter permease [Bifidobacteriaceae bacterium]|jgi:simple sugar transport system permease protein|nr:ABC transporter permease [Bifidobacteriaceae bacterium]
MSENNVAVVDKDADYKGDVLVPIQWKSPIAYGALTVLAAAIFVPFAGAGSITNFSFSQAGDLIEIPNVAIPSQPALIAIAVVLAGLCALSLKFALDRKKAPILVPLAFGLLFVTALLIFVLAGNPATLPVTSLLSGALFLSTPLVFGSMTGLICERVGIINIAIEGQLLAGAFLAAVVGSVAANPYAGLLAAPLAGALFGLVLAVFAIRYFVDQIIVGTILNVFILGLTNYLYSTVLTQNQGLNFPPPLPTYEIPILGQIPVLGPVLFKQNVVVYIMYALVIVLQILIFKSRWGLRLRACGEHPEAADTVGIKVNRTRFRNTILGGAVAGLGGAFYTVAAGLSFNQNMTSGQGFIALAVMIMGKWTPKNAIFAALVFGFANNLQITLTAMQISIVPAQFMLMLPYLVTIVAVAGVIGTVRAPAQEGVPYKN